MGKRWFFLPNLLDLPRLNLNDFAVVPHQRDHGGPDFYDPPGRQLLRIRIVRIVIRQIDRCPPMGRLAIARKVFDRPYEHSHS